MVNVNGRLVDKEHAVISVFDHGFLYGEGVYEVLRTYDVAHQRPKQQWWMDLRPIARMLAQPGPQFYGEA